MALKNWSNWNWGFALHDSVLENKRKILIFTFSSCCDANDDWSSPAFVTWFQSSALNQQLNFSDNMHQSFHKLQQLKILGIAISITIVWTFPIASKVKSRPPSVISVSTWGMYKDMSANRRSICKWYRLINNVNI